MLKSFFNNWNFSRIFRLVLGLIIFVQAIINKDNMLACFAALFVAMPIFNMGCCSAGNCATTIPKKLRSEEIHVKEIK